MNTEAHVLVDQTRPTGWRGWIYRTAVDFAAGLGRVLFFWKTEGMENIPREGPLLVVANHPSFLDPPTLVCIMIYFAKRDVSIMAWHKLFKLPIVSFFTKVYKAYPVDRTNPGRGPYQTLISIMKKGGAAGVFPEGSRSEQRLMGPWKPGALRAALATQATIQPITFATVGEFWPRGNWRPFFFRKHRIIAHKPLTYDEYMADKPDDMRDRDYLEVVSSRIRDIINAPLIARAESYETWIDHKAREGDPLTRPDAIREHEQRIEAARARIQA